MATLFSVVHLRHSTRLAQGLMVGLVVLAVGCSEQESATELPADSPVRLEMSQMFVTVENRAGLPLTDVTISIVPYGVQGAYTRGFSRVENSEKREVVLGDFRASDGTPFSLRVVKPKTVRLQASDPAGKKYDIEVPWK